MASWSSLSTRIASLPLVICGPIVRRTEKTQVSVWIATQRQVSGVQLRVFDSPNPEPDEVPLFVSAPAVALRLGDRFFAALLTADQPQTPVVSLSPQHIYGYDIVFGSEDDAGLAAPGILNAPGSLQGDIGRVAYGDFALPSFVLPANDPGGLKLVHASCRLPHGGEADAMRAMDEMIIVHHADPVNRPQQLLLTGDQIYANDVADSMLHMVIDAQATLLGWVEPLPGNPPAEALAVGNRRDTVNDAGFTVGAGKSHLIRLGEFYSMYLLSFSDVLWADEPADFDVVYPGLPRSEMQFYFSLQQKRYETPKYAHFRGERERLIQFADALPAARKALANISSYMVFDDHEVTDDWFLHHEWCQGTLVPNGLARRIIQNGLASFALFQAWGNVPTRFAPMLQGLVLVHANRGTQAADWAALGGMVLPTLVTVPDDRSRLTNGPRWDFTIDFSGYRLVALDTRTRRGFKSDTDPPSLVDIADIANQIPAAPAAADALTIVVSAMPIIGHPHEEWGNRLKRGTPFYDEIDVDFEFWRAARDGYEKVLERLAPLRRVLILSGDLHYGFSAWVNYWNRRSGSMVPSILVQLVSSPLKNVGDAGAYMTNRRLPDPKASMGWNTPGVHIEHAQDPNNTGPTTLRLHIEGTPPVFDFGHSLGGVERVLTPGDWSYRIHFAQDARPEGERGIPAAGPLPSQPFERLGQQHERRRDWGAHRIVVGKDHLATISFSWGASKSVNHEFWYVPSDPDQQLLFPYTRHTLSMELPPIDQAPG
ncbi:MAG TPA: hypothetical protein VF062_20290 [Candidatus Limnocylindrales bacterium]